jgi:hypothetical protein
MVHEDDGAWRPLLHPADAETGSRYRPLPMTRAVLAERVTPEAARRYSVSLRAVSLRASSGSPMACG